MFIYKILSNAMYIPHTRQVLQVKSKKCASSSSLFDATKVIDLKVV